MAIGHPNRREKAGAAAGAMLVQFALLYVLIAGLAMGVEGRRDTVLASFDVTEPPPPPEPVIPEARHHRTEGEAAPPALRADPTDIVAPTPVPTPVPVAAAPIAGSGTQAAAGAAPVPGPGTGAGGVGDGRGSGDSGDGDGDGGTPLRWRSGEIRDSDYPREALRAGIGGTVGLRFTVGVKGRVTDCTVTRSSGNAALDETTCRLILRRFRYEPSRDARGRPYADVVTGEHIWEVWRRPESEPPPD